MCGRDVGVKNDMSEGAHECCGIRTELGSANGGSTYDAVFVLIMSVETVIRVYMFACDQRTYGPWELGASNAALAEPSELRQQLLDSTGQHDTLSHTVHRPCMCLPVQPRVPALRGAESMELETLFCKMARLPSCRIACIVG